MATDVIDVVKIKDGANQRVADVEDVRGAFGVVPDLAARDAIQTSCLRDGAVVRIGATSTYYQWSGSAWTLFVFGGGTGDIKADGTVPFAADQSMGSHRLTDLATPTSASDAATKAYVDAVTPAGVLKADGTVGLTADWAAGAHDITVGQDPGTGNALTRKSYVDAQIAAAISTVVDWKQSCRAATTVDIALSGAQSIDGVSVAAGDRVLVKNQTTASQNGIYVAALGAWSRATDADANAEVTSGLACVVEEGAVNGQKLWILTTANPIVVGTTALSFSALSGGVSAGNGLTGTSTLAVLPDGASIAVSASGVKVAAGGVGTTEIASGAVTAAKLASLSLTDIAAVEACTTANISITGAQTPDGVTLTNGVSRVLVAFQTAPAENGVYLYNSGGAWTRTTDFDAPGEFRLGVPFLIKQGTLYGGQLAAVVTAPLVLGTDPIAFLIGRTSNFGTEDIRTNAHIIPAASGAPSATSDVGSFESCTTGSGSLRGLCVRQASADTNAARSVLQKCRGTHAAPAAHSAGDALGERVTRSYDGSAFYDAAVIAHEGVSAGGTNKRARQVIKLHDGNALRTIHKTEAVRVSTTDATLTTALSLSMAADDMFSIAVRWHGKQASSSNRCIKEATIIARRIGSAHPTVTITPVTSLTKDDSAWGSDSEIVCTPNTGTDALDFTVKGKAATNIDWDVEVSWRAL